MRSQDTLKYMNQYDITKKACPPQKEIMLFSFCKENVSLTLHYVNDELYIFITNIHIS